jgi:hypothetical protein
MKTLPEGFSWLNELLQDGDFKLSAYVQVGMLDDFYAASWSMTHTGPSSAMGTLPKSP